MYKYICYMLGTIFILTNFVIFQKRKRKKMTFKAFMV